MGYTFCIISDPRRKRRRPVSCLDATINPDFGQVEADPAVINKGKQLGMNNYLPKPFQTADLKQAIEAIVGRL